MGEGNGHSADRGRSDEPFIHQVCVYDRDAEFLATAVPFVQEGLVRDEPVLAVTSAANMLLLAGALGAVATRVHFVGNCGWYRRPATTLSAYAQYVDACSARPGRVRVIGEPVWTGRSPREVLDWKLYESALNVACATLRAWVICPYDARVVDADVVADALRTHPDQVAGGRLFPSPEFVDPPDFFRTWEGAFFAEPPADASILPFTGDLHSIRSFTTAQAIGNGVPADRAAVFGAAASEVAGYLSGFGGGRAAVQVWTVHNEIACDVHDPDAQVPEAVLGYRPPGPEPSLGDCMWFVRQVCDFVHVASCGPGARIRIWLRHRG
ncbi:MAG: anti-sigma factor RsbA family regulatory protein [Stackebrandtia sp.]